MDASSTTISKKGDHTLKAETETLDKIKEAFKGKRESAMEAPLGKTPGPYTGQPEGPRGISNLSSDNTPGPCIGRPVEDKAQMEYTEQPREAQDIVYSRQEQFRPDPVRPDLTLTLFEGGYLCNRLTDFGQTSLIRLKNASNLFWIKLIGEYWMVGPQ